MNADDYDEQAVSFEQIYLLYYLYSNHYNLKFFVKYKIVNNYNHHLSLILTNQYNKYLYLFFVFYITIYIRLLKKQQQQQK